VDAEDLGRLGTGGGHRLLLQPRQLEVDHGHGRVEPGQLGAVSSTVPDGSSIVSSRWT
jgi:hypothetical protein